MLLADSSVDSNQPTKETVNMKLFNTQTGKKRGKKKVKQFWIDYLIDVGQHQTL